MGILKQASSAAGRLYSCPRQPIEAGAPGLHPLNLDGQRDGFLYVPTSYSVDRPLPLLLMLHGAGGNATGGLSLLEELAETFPTIVLAVDSRQQTWDVIISDYGADITFIDQALAQTFSRYAVDPDRAAIGGFSDGASYALSVGLTNGDLFTHILAFSPGFINPAMEVGDPHIFIAHGQRDTVLPIGRCSRRIVPQLQQAGYEVLYREFDGAHIVLRAIAREGMAWLAT